MKRKTAILLCMTMIACGCLSCGQNKPVADATEEAQEESAPGDVQEMTGEADDSEDAQDGSTEAQEATGSDQSDDSEGEDDAGAAESDPEDTPKLSETVTSSRDMFADFIMGKVNPIIPSWKMM